MMQWGLRYGAACGMAGVVVAGAFADDATAPAEAVRWGRLARALAERGRSADANGAWARVLDLAPDDRVARAVLGFERARAGWAPRAAARERLGMVRWGERWLLPAEAARRQRRGETRPAAAPSTVQLLREALDVAVDREVRAACCRRLAECDPASGSGALGRAAVSDRDQQVRTVAFDALRSQGPDVAAVAMYREVRSGTPQERVRAAEALGTLHDAPLAPRLALAAWVQVLGQGPRVNLFVGSEVAYLRDFDVEVA